VSRTGVVLFWTFTLRIFRVDMFESLSGKLGEVFERLRKRGALSESDVSEALREVRVALLEADVALPVVKTFIDGVKSKAVGQDVLRSVTPGQQVIKIVHDHLVEMLGGGAEAGEDDAGISLAAVPPVPVLMVGLQGSGKTTSTAKIALRLINKERKKVLMASLDVYRPAAQEQLKILGEQNSIPVLPIVAGQMPVDIAKRALQAAKLGGYDVLMLDTAGRLHIDDMLMQEVTAVRDAVQPHETLLVADSLTGQDAVNVAKSFNDRVGVTGIVLTRVDGDGRGGAALSMRAVTGKPIKLIGVGEKVDALEPFHPQRIAQRILGMGDIVSLVEKAAETIEKEEAERLAARVQKGQFDLNDMASQLKQLRKMGGMSGVMNLLPGVGKVKQQMAEANVDENVLKRQEAIIGSMTLEERKNPKVIHASRKKRIASGSGTSVQDVNKLLKQHLQMADMMKRMSKLGQKGFMRSMGAMLPGMPGMPKLH
jgi:signal recognition particle subunit SRP54